MRRDYRDDAGEGTVHLMAGRDTERDEGFDDWFDEPEPPPQRRRRGGWRAAGESGDPDAWAIPDTRARRQARLFPREPIVVGGRTITVTQLAVATGSAIVVLIALLAAFGAFSGSSPKPAATPTVPVTPAPPATAGPTTTATVQAPTAALKPGDTGAQVTLLQNALTALGYSPGKADGSYGPATQAAVKSFQTASGLAADGVCGPKTLAALQQALAAKSG